MGVLPHTCLYLSLCYAIHRVLEAQSVIFCTMIFYFKLYTLNAIHLFAKEHRFMSFKGNWSVGVLPHAASINIFF